MSMAKWLQETHMLNLRCFFLTLALFTIKLGDSFEGIARSASLPATEPTPTADPGTLIQTVSDEDCKLSLKTDTFLPSGAPITITVGMCNVGTNKLSYHELDGVPKFEFELSNAAGHAFPHSEHRPGDASSKDSIATLAPGDVVVETIDLRKTWDLPAAGEFFFTVHAAIGDAGHGIAPSIKTLSRGIAVFQPAI
jgi:hypothetical protein